MNDQNSSNSGQWSQILQLIKNPQARGGIAVVIMALSIWVFIKERPSISNIKETLPGIFAVLLIFTCGILFIIDLNYLKYIGRLFLPIMLLLVVYKFLIKDEIIGNLNNKVKNSYSAKPHRDSSNTSHKEKNNINPLNTGPNNRETAKKDQINTTDYRVKNFKNYINKDELKGVSTWIIVGKSKYLPKMESEQVIFTYKAKKGETVKFYFKKVNDNKECVKTVYAGEVPELIRTPNCIKH